MPTHQSLCDQYIKLVDYHLSLQDLTQLLLFCEYRCEKHFPHAFTATQQISIHIQKWSDLSDYDMDAKG